MGEVEIKHNCKPSSLTKERLRELLTYDPDTGLFSWRISDCNRKKGTVAGCVKHDGGGLYYRYISIDRRVYSAHRLVWMYVHGVWPKCIIDHINGVGDDNRIENLREATLSENSRNRRIQPNNTSGFKGVSLHKKTGKWAAYVTHNGKTIHLGLFVCPEQAYATYKAASSQLHGDFCRHE